jgi:CHAT domain-containing protein
MAGDVLLSYNETKLEQLAELQIVPDDGRAEGVTLELWRQGQTESKTVRPGKLGVSIANEPARDILAEKKRIDLAVHTVRTGNDTFDELPGTAWEVTSLTKRFRSANQPVYSMLGLDANEQKISELAAADELAKYQYIHLATHGKIDDAYPQRTAVALSDANLPDPKEQARKHLPIFDGRLSVDEIRSEWRLAADLVTLSACDSALGKRAGGEGYIGFTQALLASGANAVCLSLWQVDDNATMLLMDRFYANLLGQRHGLSQGLPKAQALTEAQSWLRSLTTAEAEEITVALTDGVLRGKGHRPNIVKPKHLLSRNADSHPYRHPYFWAAFVIIGKPQ